MASLAGQANVASPRVLVSASGSGGHLFPAAFIIQALRQMFPDAQINFVGSGRELEREIIGPLHVPCAVIDIVGVKNRGLGGFLQFLRKLPFALYATHRLLTQIRPDVVIGVGGYATVLPVMLARLRGTPTWIHEAERKPGLANYILSFFASRVSVAFEDTKLPRPKKKVFTGHPLRSNLVALAEERPVFKTPLHLLVLGGSQGADSLDRVMCALASSLSSAAYRVLHQARPANVEMVAKAYREVGLEAQVVPFVSDMAEAFRWAHLVISRSGAGSVMELGVVNRPSILIPLPFSQGNHQEVNARLLADRGKALVVQEGEGFAERLLEAIQTLSEEQEYVAMVNRPAVDRSRDAAQQIASKAVELIRR